MPASPAARRAEPSTPARLPRPTMRQGACRSAMPLATSFPINARRSMLACEAARPSFLARRKAFSNCNRGRHADETYIKARGRWMYLHRVIDSSGDTVEFWLSEHRDLSAAKLFFRKAFARHDRPERIVIDGSQTNREATISCDTTSRLQDRSCGQLKPVRIRQSQYMNNRVEQDHRRIKRRVRPMLGFKSFSSAVAAAHNTLDKLTSEEWAVGR